MEKQVIQSVGFRNIKDEEGNVTGFQFKVRLPYYRGIFLSQIRPGTLYIDGEKLKKTRSSGISMAKISRMRKWHKIFRDTGQLQLRQF